MDRCKEIVANVKMEECYSGLSLTFDGSAHLRKEIEEAISKISQSTKMKPEVFDNSKDGKEAVQSLYLEFSNEVQRDSGEFFTLILKELRIDKCVNEVIKED